MVTLMSLGEHVKSFKTNFWVVLHILNLIRKDLKGWEEFYLMKINLDSFFWNFIVLTTLLSVLT